MGKTVTPSRVTFLPVAAAAVVVVVEEVMTRLMRRVAETGSEKGVQ